MQIKMPWVLWKEILHIVGKLENCIIFKNNSGLEIDGFNSRPSCVSIATNYYYRIQNLDIYFVFNFSTLIIHGLRLYTWND